MNARKIDKLKLFADLGYVPHPGQLEIHLAEVPRRVVACGVRWGKTKCAAMDLAKFGIRVNAVQPGFINTNIFSASLEVGEADKAQVNAMIAQMSSYAQPVPRGGQPRDIAEAVAFLASDAASFMTGASMIVDGGITVGPRHSWDPEAPGLFDTIQKFLEAKEAGGSAQ